MIAKDLLNHGAEFARAIRNLKFERTSDGGLFFPAQKAIARGVYATRVNGGGWQYDNNILPTEGLTYLMSLLGAGSKLATWYIALYAGAITPGAGLTAATFASVTSEITSTSEGYTSATRPAWVPGTAAASGIDNNASPTTFTIATASTLTINGVAMLSSATRGGTSGVLISSARFANPRVFNDTDEFDIKYALGLTSS